MDTTSGSLFRLLLESAPDAIVGVDRAGLIRIVNRQAEILFGYGREELIGQNIELLVPDRFHDVHPEHRRNYESNPSTRPMGAELDLAARRKDGSEFPVDISLSTVETEDGPIVSAAIRDISDRKKSEAKFQGLLESAPDAIVWVDGDGVIRLANRQTEALFGYARDELIGQHVEMLVPDRFRPGHPGRRASYVADPTTRPMGAGLDLAARRRDGSEFPVDISLSRVETEEGVLVSAAIRDITDRVRAEREKEALAARIREEARIRQSERLESLGQLAGGVAHDFNNLLAVIINYADFVLEALDGDGQADRASTRTIEMSADVRQIREAAERAAALTRQLLIFSRREVTKPQRLDLNLVVTELESLLRRTLGEHVELRTKLKRPLSLILADRGQLEQVLVNLAVNARDAMPGGGTLVVETGELVLDGEQAREILGDVEPGSYVMLTVADTGTGMTPEVAARAFEPFFTTKPTGAGTGLGLATVYGIVTNAGGKIVLYSEPGHGTAVKVFLPATERAHPDPEWTVEVDDPTEHGGTILLVEDERQVGEVARRVLASAGYTVVLAVGPADALERARSMSHIDLLLTDVVMPEMSGKDLAARLCAQRPTLRVLYMSGYPEDVIAHQGALDPGVILLQKPFTKATLLDAVRSVIDVPAG